MGSKKKKILDGILIEIEKLRSRKDSVFNIPQNLKKNLHLQVLKSIVIQIYATIKKKDDKLNGDIQYAERGYQMWSEECVWNMI